MTVNDILIENLNDNEICGLIRGPLDSGVVLGFERSGTNSAGRHWVPLQRKLSTSFAPDFRSVGWQKHEVISYAAQLECVFDVLKGNLEQNKDKEILGTEVVENSMQEETEEEVILRVHAKNIHRQKYFLIL